GLVACVDQHTGGTTERDGEEHLHELGTRRHENAYVIVRLHTQRNQAAGGVHGTGYELAIGPGRLREDQCRVVGELIVSLEEQVPESCNVDAMQDGILADVGDEGRRRRLAGTHVVTPAMNIDS